jgi:dTDP-4-amino-4,6-dideoxygalactose transaminase
VALSDAKIGERVTQALNFGFRVGRDSEIPHINGKLSEYHAAVGLAALDCWPETFAGMRAVADGYRDELAGTGLAERLVAAPDVGSSYVLMRCESALQSERVQESLAQSSVDYRLWYGKGLHTHHYFAELAHDPLPVTDSIAPRLLGLPLAVDLSRGAIQQVVSALVRGSTARP